MFNYTVPAIGGDVVVCVVCVVLVAVVVVVRVVLVKSRSRGHVSSGAASFVYPTYMSLHWLPRCP